MASRSSRSKDASRDDALVVPVVAESAVVSRERREAARVRVRKRVSTHDVPVDLALTRERVEVSRVPVNREVAAPPPVRQEGDTTIVPVLEERLVVEKRLVLREEVHIRRIASTRNAHERVPVRAEEVEVERIVAGDVQPGGVGPSRRARR